MNDNIDDLLAEAEKLAAAPSDEQLRSLKEAGMLLFQTEASIADLEGQLEKAKERRRTLAHKTLPDIMNNIGSDSLGLSEVGADLELVPFAHASIPKDWPEERREAAFRELEEHDAGDLVKSLVTIAAGRGDLASMRKLMELIEVLVDAPYTDDQSERVEAVANWLHENGADLERITPSITLDLTVQWNTLTSFVKEQVKNGVALNLEALNATVGQVVKIKMRKD